MCILIPIFMQQNVISLDEILCPADSKIFRQNNNPTTNMKCLHQKKYSSTRSTEISIKKKFLLPAA